MPACTDTGKLSLGRDLDALAHHITMRKSIQKSSLRSIDEVKKPKGKYKDGLSMLDEALGKCTEAEPRQKIMRFPSKETSETLRRIARSLLSWDG